MLNSSYIGVVKYIYTAFCCVCVLCGCNGAAEDDMPTQVRPPVSTDDHAPEQGMKRLYIRTSTSLGQSSCEIVINGRSHVSVYDPSLKQWYVDTEINAFDTYSAELVSESSSYWYDGAINSDIHLPHTQFQHKSADLDAIPMFAEYDPDDGEFLDFIPPYATLEFDLSGMTDIVSLRLEADIPLCGTAAWSRAKREFVFSGISNEAVLNCVQASDNRSLRMRVFGRNYSNVKLRVCNAFHKSKEIFLGELKLTPGLVHKIKADVTPDEELLWFDGFDRCVWGGDPVGNAPGLAPSEDIPSLDGDLTKDGYEYALATVPADVPGSGFIQNSFAGGQSNVSQNHRMSESYIRSRGFADNRYMLRCRECKGYLSVGTGDARRGWFALYPLQKAGLTEVRNLELSFRIALHKSCADDVLLLINGSEDAITKHYIDNTEGPAEAVSQYGTSDTLRLTPTALGKGVWRNVKVCIDNCTDLTALHWQGATSEDGAHGFYLDEISVREVKGSWRQEGKLRILYWNIQNGMWADQPYYDDFVDFVKKHNPDVCVWCEAKSNHLTGSETSWKDDPYLPDNWNVLAARYGHGYTAISRRGTEKFPQVVTSKFPIEKLLQIGDVPEGDPVLHGAGLFEICLQGGAAHILTIHLKPNSGLSVAEAEKYRSYELEHILDATVNNADYRNTDNWIVLGDFNADSRKDAPFHNYVDAGTHYLAHDYISENTSLIDVIATRYPDTFMYTTASSRRIDYVYMDSAAYGKVVEACVLAESWTAPVETSLSNFCKPSDHLPILIDMKY